MSYIFLISGEMQELPVKDIKHVGTEGARQGTAVLPDGREVPVYNHPDTGRDVWYEQESQANTSQNEVLPNSQ